MLKKGIIVSIQNYSKKVTNKFADNAIKGGAIAIRTDKKIKESKSTIIGLKKSYVKDKKIEPYITCTIEDVKKISRYTDYIAIDYRLCNYNLQDIQKYCKKKNLKVIADIGTAQDVVNIIKNNYYYTYIATTFNVFYDYDKNNLINDIKRLQPNTPIIAEGGYDNIQDIIEAFKIGAHCVCIGKAITDITYLTNKYARVINESCY